MRAKSVLIALAAGSAGALVFAEPTLSQAPVKAGGSQSALAPSALSQSAPTADDNAIVITGKTDAKPAEIRKQATEITKTVVRYHNPLAKFQDKVCPGIVGMPVDMAEIMIDRIRYNAERVGIDTAMEGKCQPNIMVIFVRNGQGVIKELRKTKDYIFRKIDLQELRALAKDSGPVHAWTNTEVRSRQGDTLQGDNDADLTQIPVLNVAQSQSHIFLANRLDITNSILLIDIPAIDGMSVVQIADYVTMRAFAQTKPVNGDPAASTILTLFDPENTAAPRELTDFDLAYLRTVYQGVDSLNAASKLASITTKLRTVQAERAGKEAAE